MRIAFIDLTFHWPATGGSWIDLYELMTRLQNRGHEVALFVPRFQYGIVPRGRIDETLPFPVHAIPFTKTGFNFYQAPRKFKQEIDRYKPDIVFIGDAYTLKPYLGLIFKNYPVIQRFYGHELICPNYIGLIKNGKVCDIHYLKTPLYCTYCALRTMRGMFARFGMDEFIHEYITGLGFLPTFLMTVKKDLRNATEIIVSNEWMRNELVSLNPYISVLPGGVDIQLFHPASDRKSVFQQNPKTIFMPGRVQDGRKGVDCLRQAARELSVNRQDFKILLTDAEKYDDGLFQSTGWLNRELLAEYYRNSYMCIIPSAWHEPFGLVTLEAMASGIPVIGSDIGGIHDTIREGNNGMKFPMNDSHALAEKMNYLLDHPELAEVMGREGRRLAESEYTWDRIVDQKYIPLFQDVVKRYKSS